MDGTWADGDRDDVSVELNPGGGDWGPSPESQEGRRERNAQSVKITKDTERGRGRDLAQALVKSK